MKRIEPLALRRILPVREHRREAAATEEFLANARLQAAEAVLNECNQHVVEHRVMAAHLAAWFSSPRLDVRLIEVALANQTMVAESLAWRLDAECSAAAACLQAREEWERAAADATRARIKLEAASLQVARERRRIGRARADAYESELDDRAPRRPTILGALE